MPIFFILSAAMLNVVTMRVIGPSIRLSICLFTHPSVHPSIHSSACLSICPSVYQILSPSVHSSVPPSVYSSISLYICSPFACLTFSCVCLPSHPSICLSLVQLKSHLFLAKMAKITPKRSIEFGPCKNFLLKKLPFYCTDCPRLCKSLQFNNVKSEKS
jgi:hypothetical protein